MKSPTHRQKIAGMRPGAKLLCCMTPTSLIVVADRGGIKAYRVNETPTREPACNWCRRSISPTRMGVMIDKLTDQAGRFPVSDGNGSSRSDRRRTQLETETDRRICKQLAEQITKMAKTKGARRVVFRRARLLP